MSFVKVGSTGDLKSSAMKGIEVNGKPILLANLADKYYAIGNICTHRGCKLSNGALNGDVVQCGCHGSRFDVKTGKVVGGPAARPEPSYEVQVKDDQILVKT